MYYIQCTPFYKKKQYFLFICRLLLHILLCFYIIFLYQSSRAVISVVELETDVINHLIILPSTFQKWSVVNKYPYQLQYFEIHTININSPCNRKVVLYLAPHWPK